MISNQRLLPALGAGLTAVVAASFAFLAGLYWTNWPALVCFVASILFIVGVGPVVYLLTPTPAPDSDPDPVPETLAA